MSAPTIAGENVIYSQPGCPPCEDAKNYLDKYGIKYKSCDISKDRQCMKEFNELGGSGTPLIILNGERIDGFDKDALNRALKAV